MAANQPIIDLVSRFAQRENATPSQVALAWLLAQKPWIVPIPGTRSQEHLQENLGALRVELSADDLREMNKAFAAATVHGGRMNAEQMQVVDTAA
jgi:aryl-alcohol dehydrogenase-like predicted oxidoreductase